MQPLAFNTKTLLTCLFSMIFFLAHGQNADTVALKGFVRDAIDTKLTTSELAEKYLCTNILTSKEKYGVEARAHLEFAFVHQRKYLRDKQINANKVSLKPFGQLSESELPPKPFHMLHETSNVYAAVYEGQVCLFFLLNKDKIASTLLIGQGDEHYFVDFCH
jgi:hypothetical protein